ncbi:MAG TPA: EAL domain-containing protein [Bacillaceae bacterium]
MIRTFSYTVESESRLLEWIHKKDLTSQKNLLIQAFAPSLNAEEMEQMRIFLTKHLPQAVIAGCNSPSASLNGNIEREKTVLSFSIFQRTSLRSRLIAANSGKAEYVPSAGAADQTKAVFVYAVQSSSILRQTLHALSDRHPEVCITGGVIGSAAGRYPPCVFNNDGVSTEGIVFVSLAGEGLSVSSRLINQHQIPGPSITVTDADGKVITGLNRQNPSAVLERYLGYAYMKTFAKGEYPEFSFILESNREYMVPGFLRQDGFIEFPCRVEQGDRLRIGVLNLEELNRSIDEYAARIKETETVFGFHSIHQFNCKKQSLIRERKLAGSASLLSGMLCHNVISNEGPSLECHFANSYLCLSETAWDDCWDDASRHVCEAPASEVAVWEAMTKLVQASAEDYKKLSARYAATKEYYHSIVENNPDIICTVDLEGHFTSVNPAFVKTFGYTMDQLEGVSALSFVHGRERRKIEKEFQKTIEGKAAYFEIKLRVKSGRTDIFEIHLIPVTVKGECVGVFGVGHKITEQRRIEEKMKRMAYFDELTGLPNRANFVRLLKKEVRKAEAGGRSLAVMFLDLERFKVINDTFGHHAGDIVLKELANRILSVLPDHAFLGRFADDKFTILLAENAKPEEIIHVGNHVFKTFQQPFIFDSQEFFVTVSIGASMYPFDGIHEVDLMKNADAALNRAKHTGVKGISFYSDNMNKESLQRMELERSLRRAIENEEFFIAYQPIIDSRSREVKACEALIRWEHPVQGIIPPSEFIPIAEETGLIGPLGNWVMKSACRQVKEWQDDGFSGLHIAVNVSAHQFQNRRFVEDVKNALAYSGLEPEFLHLELTESAMLNQMMETINTMKALGELGVKISIDDFGTGYSSLSYLKHLPIQKLKIDRSFISQLSIDSPDFAIVNAILTMGHGLGLKVVAEGVESEEQLDLVTRLGCDFAQGYLIEKPLEATRFMQWYYTASL